MNFVIISPHFPPNYHRFWKELKQRGVNTLGIGEDSYDYLDQEVKDSLTAYYRVNSLNDYDQLYRACGYFTHQYGKIDRVESHNEFWLELDARLRTDYNVPGLKTADMYPIKYKSGMKPFFQKAGIATAAGILLHSPNDATEFIAAHGYPVIAKPDNGVGAYATYKLKNDQELETFLAEKLPVDYFLESFVSGTIHSFDGLTDQNGEIVISSGLVYGVGVMESVNESLDMFIYIPRIIHPKIVEAGKAALKIFGLKERFFHLEFFLTDNHEVIALELNARPPGGMIIDMINYANEINAYQIYAEMITGKACKATLDRPYNCFYLGRKNHFYYRYSTEDLARKYSGQIVFHGPISPAFSAAMGDYAIIFRTKNLEEGLAIQRSAMEKII